MTKTMAAVLAEHQLFDSWWSAEKGAELKCTCTSVASYDDTTETDHEAHGRHQAAALTTAGFGLVADAKAEALDEAAAEFGPTYHGLWLQASAKAMRGEG